MASAGFSCTEPESWQPVAEATGRGYTQGRAGEDPVAGVESSGARWGQGNDASMPFEFFDHTGDIGVRVSGATIDDLFADAAMALTATLTDAATIQPRERAWIVLEAPSLDLLLVDWLNEIVFRFDVDEMLIARTAPRVTQEGDTWKLEAAVEGETIEAARHRVKLLIKGVTFHQLAIARSDRGFETSVVFDI